GLGAISTKTNVENRPKFPTAKGGGKSAFDISRKFCLSILADGQQWVQQQGLSPAGNIIVAEPLQFYVDDHGSDWLQNYRAHMRRILSRHFSRVDFLPEPFAVFQYYRVG